MACKVDKKKKSDFDWSKFKVYVHGPGAFQYMRMFRDRGLNGTNNIDEADFVCFTGGADVDPELYGEKNLKVMGRDKMYREISHIDKARDDVDMRVFGYAADKVKIGICRGGQFLNVMNGGKMWQHVDHHAGAEHELTDTVTGEVVKVTSTHHQMMRPAENGMILAKARESSMKLGHEDEWHLEHDHKDRPEELDDIEVVWYEESKSLCFQPHPEFGGTPACTDYFFSLLERTVTA